MNETVVRKVYGYVIPFVDVEEHKTLYLAKGKAHQVLQGFCNNPQEHNASPEQIKKVSCDMSLAFIKAVQENEPT